MTEKIIIALDQGSSASRAVAITRGGAVLAKEIIPVSLRVNGAECDYDAQDLLSTQINALDKIIAANLGQITAIAVCAQRSTIVMWDKTTGKALGPALSWLDGRAASIAAQNPLTQDEIHSRTGLYKTPYYSAPKIKWCLQNFPAAQEVLAKGNLLCGPVASWLIWHMTGGKIFAADITNAQRTLLFNIKTMDWDNDILKSFAIPREILPQILPSAADYGSYKDIPITVCVGDQQAAAAATGLLKQGDCSINYGTGAFALLNIGQMPVDIPGILTSVAFNTAKQKNDFILEGPVNAAGSLFTWLNSVGLDFDARDLDNIAAVSKTPAQVYPALGGIGAPLWDFSVMPVLTGLKPNTSKADIVAGTMRGLCFFVADIVNYINKAGFTAERVQASGGLAASAALLKFQSAVLQRPIIRAKETETAALGAAYISALNAGIDTSSWQAFKNYEVFEPEIPSREAAELYASWRAFADWALKQPK